MDKVRVTPERLRRRFDSSLLGFETTEGLREEPAGFIGQPRALEAIAFGLEGRPAATTSSPPDPPGPAAGR